MDIRIATTSATTVAADAMVVGILKDGQNDALEGLAAAFDAALDGSLETTVVHTLSKLEPPRIVLVGLGSRKDFSFETLRLRCWLPRRPQSRSATWHWRSGGPSWPTWA